MHIPYKKVFDSFPVASFITTDKWEVLAVNRTGRQMLDIARMRILHSDLREHIAFKDKTSDTWQNIAEILYTHLQYDTEMVLKDHPHHRESFFGHFAALLTHNETHYFSVSISEQANAVQLNRTLNNKDLKIAQVQSELMRYTKEARDLSKLKSNFLSIASHELKTPLTSIKGYSDLLIESTPGKIEDGFVAQLIKNINRSSTRLTNVVNNILDISRVQEKRIELHPEYSDITEIVTDCIEELTPISETRHIGFHCDFADNLPRFYGDKSRIYRQFFNILTNAIKFSPDHSCINIKVRMENPDNYHISVRDAGIGIPKEERKRIFEPFVKLGSTNKHTSQNYNFMGGGAGLGLSVVKGILECHGGHIWVESSHCGNKDEMPGSVFHMILPHTLRVNSDICKKSRDESNTGGNDESKLKLPQQTEAMPEILLIDNNPDTTGIIKKMLHDAFELIIATSAEEALTTGFSSSSECILINEALKGLDAIRLSRIFRTQPETKATPLGLYSSVSDESRIRDAFNVGADEYIVLPLSDRDFVEKIWHLLIKKKESSFFA